jgi:hypothetical protein
MSLLQDVLRSHTADAVPLEKRLSNVRLSPSRRPTSDDDKDDSDDDLVNVVCTPEFNREFNFCPTHLRRSTRFRYQEPQTAPGRPRLFAVLLHGLCQAHSIY